MKLYTSPEQTERIYEITGKKPKDLHPVSDNGDNNGKFSMCVMRTAYDIGELLEIITSGKWGWRLEIAEFNGKIELTSFGKAFLTHPFEGEIIDALYDLIVEIKEKNID